MTQISLRAALLAGLLAAPAGAQSFERGAFLMVASGDTVLVERFTRTHEGVHAEAAVAGRARVDFSFATASDASMTFMELRAWPASAPDTAAPVQHIVVRWAADSAVSSVEAGGRSSAAVVHGAAGAVALFNPSAVLLEQLLLRARALSPRDSASVTAFAVGTPQTVVGRVRWLGADSALLQLGPTELRLRVDAAGHLLGGTIPSQRLALLRVADATGIAAGRPDYSAPAGAPYSAVEVRVPQPAGFTLGATLTLPTARSGRVPAVVTITGSGLEDRDERIPGVRGYRPFRQLADTLGRRGIAVLRLDDRGFGASGGDPTRATSRDFADDVAAAVAWLRTRPEIDPERIALVGHSEGGIIAPLVAVADPRLKAIVLMAGTARTGRHVLDYQLRRGIEADTSIAPGERERALRAAWARVDSLAEHTPWLPFFFDYDPRVTARRVRQPVLVLQGGTDQQVTADQAPELAAALRAGGNRAVTLRVFPGLNHLFVPDPSGDPGGYARLPSTAVSPQVLGTMADWLAATLR